MDIASPPKKALLALLAAHATGADRDRLALLASRGGRAEYDAFIVGQGLSLPDVLALFPSSRPPLGPLLSCLAPLAPRLYSVACSPLAARGTVTIALAVVSYTTGGAGDIVRAGLCSSWLERLCAPLLAGGECDGGGGGGEDIYISPCSCAPARSSPSPPA